MVYKTFFFAFRSLIVDHSDSFLNGFCFSSYVQVYQIPRAALGPRPSPTLQNRNRGFLFLFSAVLMNEQMKINSEYNNGNIPPDFCHVESAP